MSAKYAPKTALGRAVHVFEESAIAVILGVMTVMTFMNVVLRYVFNTSVIWAPEATQALFAWLVLFGMSYAVKVTAHLGVDAVIAMVPQRSRRIMALISALACLLYAVLLMKGAWDYFAPFAGFEQTGGRWFPTGFIKTRDQAWYETEQIPMPAILHFLEPMFNQGEAYGKLPRFIPYAILPIGAALLLFRVIQASVEVVRGNRDSLIVSHEAEDAIDDVRHLNDGE
ncbi:TRAP transporter small permease [Phaeovulum sp. W22_SRMD_FR3]|uniref:TRAP transporter small permease n=1 Tax=Phaeovulum sp. W22_SRMD_FR3 TaxID=3240274 RepID=UPI003F9A7008